MQQFEFLTRGGRIVMFKPFNPLTDNLVAQINDHPIEQQAQFLSEVLRQVNSGGRLEVIAVNGEYDVVLYSLDIQVNVLPR